MASVVVSISAPEDEVAAWRAAADVVGARLSIWARAALVAAAEATQDEARHSADVERLQVGNRERAELIHVDSAPAGDLPPLPPGATTVAIDADLEDRLRQRGLVAQFIRSGGREWRGHGPNPLHPGCTIRRDVLAEVRGKLDQVAHQMAVAAADAALIRGAGAAL